MMMAVARLCSAVLVITGTTKCYGFQLPSGAGRHRTLSLQLKLSSTSPSSSTSNRNKETSESEWKEMLSPERYYVLREEGTEGAWTSPFNDLKDDGIFCCGGCDAPLFTTSTKYESGSGWPSFYAPIDEDAVDLSIDYKLVVPRTEVSCKTCGGHLGHVFDDGPAPTGKRYCMNGIAMDFVMDGDDPQLATAVMERTSKYESSGGVAIIKQPLMAILPGLALEGTVAVLYIASFISQHTNENGGLDLFSNDNGGIDQAVELISLGIGVWFARSAFLKASDLVNSLRD